MGLESLGKKLAKLGKDTKDSMKNMSKSYQANSQLNSAKDELEALYAELGKKAASLYEEFAPEQMRENLEKIVAKKKEIEDIECELQRCKGVVYCPNCGAESSKEQNFCSVCGTKLPTWEEDKDSVIKEDMREVGREAGDVLNEAADKARDFISDAARKAASFAEGVKDKAMQDDDIVDVEPTAEEEVKEETEAQADPVEEEVTVKTEETVTETNRPVDADPTEDEVTVTVEKTETLTKEPITEPMMADGEEEKIREAIDEAQERQDAADTKQE